MRFVIVAILFLQTVSAYSMEPIDECPLFADNQTLNEPVTIGEKRSRVAPTLPLLPVPDVVNPRKKKCRVKYNYCIVTEPPAGPCLQKHLKRTTLIQKYVRDYFKTHLKEYREHARRIEQDPRFECSLREGACYMTCPLCSARLKERDRPHVYRIMLVHVFASKKHDSTLYHVAARRVGLTEEDAWRRYREQLERPAPIARCPGLDINQKVIT